MNMMQRTSGPGRHWPADEKTASSHLGIVVIGQNLGRRLFFSLCSVLGQSATLVYVDSGSTDGSVELASEMGVDTVKVDPSLPFTAARARNAGFAHIVQVAPEVDYVQFVDGDCEMDPGWLDCAKRELDDRPDTALVCGRRCERFPDRSIYNRLCQIEWQAPPGQTKACGGDALVRRKAFDQVGGFKSSLIAGEEPELCLRLRRHGWKIWRLDRAMTVHDAQMTHPGQWWRRSVRAGHAFAEGAWLHGAGTERHWVHETRSLGFWGVLLPLTALALARPTRGASLLALAGYPLLAARIFARMRRRKFSNRDAALYASACVVGKFAQSQGALQFWAFLLSREGARAAGN